MRIGVFFCAKMEEVHETFVAHNARLLMPACLRARYRGYVGFPAANCRKRRTHLLLHLRKSTVLNRRKSVQQCENNHYAMQVGHG